MDVCCAPSVMTWEISIELDDTVGICFLDAAEEGAVEVCFVVYAAVAVYNGEGAAVDAGGVGACVVVSFRVSFGILGGRETNPRFRGRRLELACKCPRR